MTNEKDPKNSAKICFDSIGLDPELYRIGHTKASQTPSFGFHDFEVFLDPTHCRHSLFSFKHFFWLPHALKYFNFFNPYYELFHFTAWRIFET